MSESPVRPVLGVSAVSKIFEPEEDDGRSVTALNEVTFDVALGEFLVIVGPSGSGKSTLLNIIAKLDSATSGSIRYGDDLLVNGKLSVGFVFQRDLLLPWRTVLDNALLGLEVIHGKADAAATEKALDYLKKYGLAGFEHSYPENLSQGMRQRVGLIRTLLTEPKLLLLDEPFASLDYDVKLFLEKELLDAARKSGMTVIFVTHDIEEAVAISDRVVVFSERPGTVKSISDISFPGLSRDPIDARTYPGFQPYFAALVKQLRYWNHGERANEN